MNFHAPQDIYIELIGPVNMYLGLGIEVVLSVILGGLVGLDREQKFKSAGVKTHMLICVGATLYIATSFLNLGYGTVADPNRMAAQVVSGIGFLGAGTIFQSKGKISGLTTAATIWVVAAIGVAVGSGHPLTAFIFTMTILFVLKMIDPVYRFFGYEADYLLEIVGKGDPEKVLSNTIGPLVDKVQEVDFFIDDLGKKFVAHYTIRLHTKDMSKLGIALKKEQMIDKIQYRSIK